MASRIVIKMFHSFITIIELDRELEYSVTYIFASY